jgi:myo-inositol-1(or 4)-monophosphatase
VLVDGAAASCSDTEVFDDAVLATGFPPLKSRDLEDNLDNFTRTTRATRGVRRLGSAALDLAYVACGRLDGFWEFHLNPWDVGAGALLVRVGGGAVTTVDGDAHTGFEGSILATNGSIHSALIDTLRSA